MKFIYPILALICLAPMGLIAQENSKIGDPFLKKYQKEWSLVQKDIDDVLISSQYTSEHNGITHIYYQQAREGIPVHNGILTMNVTKENKLLFTSSTFIKDLDKKINTSISVIKPEEAIINSGQNLSLNQSEIIQIKNKGGNVYHFRAENYSNENIIAEKQYYAFNKNDVRLIWHVLISEKGNANSWSLKVDAVTGEVLNKESRTIYCNHHHGKYSSHGSCFHHSHDHEKISSSENLQLMDGDQYLVYPLPIESPVHGNQELVQSPHFSEASPFGWHDVDGVEGLEYMITRGNNTHVFQNQDASGNSKNDEPEGELLNGTDLIFNYPHDKDLEPLQNLDADAVNIFYATNMVHDITYLMGFDESAGNYQFNNYGKGGLDGDYIRGYSVDATLIPGLEEPFNNAYFSIVRDGNIGTMGMYRWRLPAVGLFTINEPNELSGGIPNGTIAGNWGFPDSYNGIDVTAELVQAFDDHPQLSDNVCGDVINDVSGKIAMIYRGTCEFGTKAFNVQNAGAVAAIICNVPGAGNDPTSDGNTPMGMGPGVNGINVTIPTLSLGFADCNKIIEIINGGTTVMATIKPQERTGPSEFSAGFDNGIIIHEYGHGISNRLTGGPNISCILDSDEQMGEGWSDFFALALTTEPGDQGADARGIGNYVDGFDANGRGIRRFPYSTNMNINPQTFKDIKATSFPHPLGEIWADMLWDIYWGYVEKYGWDADWTNSESGNFRAVQLVLDGLKMQGCGVGFIRGRDAIIAAEEVNTGGENKCMLWEMFARRGLGYFADGGSANNRNDGSENFDPLPSCLKTLKIYKNTVDLVSKDDVIDVELIIANHKDEMVNAVISDFIPDGLSYIDGSANMEPGFSGDQITFERNDFASQEWDTITYQLQYNNLENSQIIFSNTLESSQEQSEWERILIPGESVIFRINSSNVNPTFSGENAWFVQETDDDTEAEIRYNDINVTGELPVVRVWHRINTEFTRNGGFIEVSTDGVLWEDVKPYFLRNGYECPIQFTTFAIPALQGFSGRTGPNDYVDTYIDLSSFKGQTVSLRFRFGTNSGADNMANDETFPDDGGWFIDDIDLIDLVSYETQACISTSVDNECTPGTTLVFNADPSTSIIENTIEGTRFKIYPNPANDYISIELDSDKNMNANINVIGLDGRVMINERRDIHSQRNIFSLDTSILPSGFYYVQLITEEGRINSRIVIE